MPAMPGFVGGNDVQRSLNLADNRCINLYPTTDDAGYITAFYSTPGLSMYSSAASVFSGLYTASNGRAFAVSGTVLYEITTGGVLTNRGTVTSATVSRMSDNGIELIIVNGTDGWLFTFATNTLRKLSSIQANFTVTIASPAVFTSANHGLIAGDAIQLSSTTGTVASDNLLTALTPSAVSDNYSPSYMVVSPDGNFAYALNSSTAVYAGGTFGADCISQFVRDVTTGSLSPVSPQYYPLPASGNIINTITSTYGPVANSNVYSYTSLAISPDGNYIYATYRVTLLSGAFVYVLQYASRNITSGALSHAGFMLSNTADFEHIAFTSDGAYAYVTNTVSNTISQYSRNVSTGALTPLAPATIAATSPTRIVVAPDNSSVYAISNTNVIYQFSRNLVSGLLSPLGTPTIATGTTPKDIIISGDGKSVYVANYGGNTISQYSRNLSTFLLSALTPSTIATGTNPNTLVIAADGASVYVANWGSNTISMFSRDSTTSLLSVLSTPTITTENNPFGISISPNGSSVYVTNLNSASISQYIRNASSTNIGLPTGLSTLTTYYVLAAGLTANNFEVSLTAGGTPVNTSGVQAGTHTFTTLAGGFPSGCKTVSYIDGRFVACQPNTQNFYVSDVLSGSVWQTVNVQTADSNPDRIVGQIALHNELVVFCEQSGEVFYDSGQYPSPFVRNVSGIFEVGCIAPYSIAKIDNSVMWLGKSNTGQGIIYRLNGYTPVRLSTYAIEYAIQTMSTITDAQAFTYQQEGHHFYVITFPTGGRTFVFDINTGFWHERQSSTAIYSSLTSISPASISTVANPIDIVIHPSGNYAYVTSITSNNIPIYSITSGILSLLATVATTDISYGMAIHPNGNFAYKTNYNSNTLSIYSITSGILSLLATVATGTSPNSIAIHPSGNYAYVTNNIGGTVSMYSIAATGLLTPLLPATIATGSRPSSIAIHPSGNYAYVTNALGNTVSMYRITSGVLTTLTPQTIATGTEPHDIAIHPSGNYAYVTNNIGGTVSMYSIAATGLLTSLIPATIAAGVLPQNISIDSLGNYVYVTNSNSNTISMYSATSGVLSPLTPPTIATGTFPFGMVIHPDGYVYCVNNGNATISMYSYAAISYTYNIAWEGREYAYFDNKHLVTDAAEGRIYYLDPTSYTDGGVPRKWIRSWRAPPSDMKRVNHHKLWLEFEGGVGNSNSTNPQISLKYSNDGGHTWSPDNWRDVSMGTAGQYTKRIFWYRLGMTTGQPRIYELSGTAPAKTVLINAYLD